MCQPVAVGQLESSFGLELLETLERDGLIAARVDGRRQSVSLAHPLQREVLRARLRPSEPGRSCWTTPTHWSGAAPAVGTTPSASPRSDSKPPAGPTPTCSCAPPSGAIRPRPAHRGAARPGGAGQPADRRRRPGPRRGAVSSLGSFEAAETALAAAMDGRPVPRPRWWRSSPRGAATCSSVAGARTRPSRSASAAGAPHVVGVGALRSCSSGAAEVLAYSGAPSDALALLEGAEVDDPVSMGSRRVAVGGVGDDRAHRRSAGPQPARSAPTTSRRATSPPLRDRVGRYVSELFALVQAGRLGEADELGRVWLDAAVRARMSLDVSWLPFTSPAGALTQGRPATALDWVDRATTAIEAHRCDGLRPITTAVRAAAHGLLGDAVASTRPRPPSSTG